MAESASPYSQTETNTLTGPSSLGSALDPNGLPTVHEVPHLKPAYVEDDSLDNQSHPARETSGEFRDASRESSMGQSYNEKQSEDTAYQFRHTGPPRSAQDGWQRPEDPSAQLRNGYRRHTTVEGDTKPRTLRKDRNEKRGGFRNTLRRMFSRKAARNTINVPDQAVYPQHDPEDFITSATDVKTTRPGSVPAPGPVPGPAPGLMRTSGLSSHPPHQKNPSPPPAANPAPPQPKRSPPQRPERPRRASVPSLILNKHEMEVVEATMSGLGLQKSQEQTVDAENIGFAVTNGSNPRRRSRSVGAFRDTEHRMSPIQWRKWRRRSDEIKYWRQSTDLTFIGLKPSDSPGLDRNDGESKDGDDDEASFGEHNGEFNFGLPAVDPMQNQERIGLEERIVTMEIKLMDFEYTLSKIQAGSTSPARRHSQPREVGRQDSVDSYLASDQTQPSRELSSSLPQHSQPASPSKFTHDVTPAPRPTSIATTLKPGHAGSQSRPRNGSIDRSTHSSLSALTIDHYTTLITLIRHEQAARMRLEQQVSMLQGRLDHLSNPQSSQSLVNSVSQHSHSRSLSSQQRRRGFVEAPAPPGAQYRQLRPRSSSYSTAETDTDDDQYHDVYVTPDITPVERGEYERGAFDRVDVEEGMAF